MSQALPGDDEDVAKTYHVSHDTHGGLVPVTRIFAWSLVVLAFVFSINNFLIFKADWPGALALMYGEASGALPMLQLASYFLPLVAVIFLVLRSPAHTLHGDADILTGLNAYIIRSLFWGVMLVGCADAFISFLRVEGLLAGVFGQDLASELGKSVYRGTYVHYPLIAISFAIGYFVRSLGFHWLAMLIVLGELLIVLARFVFSYEQAFMADMVRLWYGALFLFASAHTLIEEAHVRVDIIYAGMSDRGKAWTNSVGSVLLGALLCWTILILGMWTQSSTINGPLLSFEVTQAGFGAYVKYLLAGFLLVFAMSMLLQFMSYFMSNVAVLLHERDYTPDYTEHPSI